MEQNILEMANSNTNMALAGLKEGMAMLFGGSLVIVMITGVIIMLLSIVIGYLIPAIALYNMAKKAGYKYSWLAFIPVAQTYLEFVLPKRDFKLGFVTKERGVVGLIFIGVTYFGGIIVGALNAVPGLGQVLDFIFMVALWAVCWRKMYDVIRTYKSKEAALTISILGMICPPVYAIALLTCINQEPDYGWGNYYYEILEDNN